MAGNERLVEALVSRQIELQNTILSVGSPEALPVMLGTYFYESKPTVDTAAILKRSGERSATNTSTTLQRIVLIKALVDTLVEACDRAQFKGVFKTAAALVRHRNNISTMLAVSCSDQHLKSLSDVLNVIANKNSMNPYWVFGGIVLLGRALRDLLAFEANEVVTMLGNGQLRSCLINSASDRSAMFEAWSVMTTEKGFLKNLLEGRLCQTALEAGLTGDGDWTELSAVLMGLGKRDTITRLSNAVGTCYGALAPETVAMAWGALKPTTGGAQVVVAVSRIEGRRYEIVQELLRAGAKLSGRYTCPYSSTTAQSGPGSVEADEPLFLDEILSQSQWTLWWDEDSGHGVYELHFGDKVLEVIPDLYEDTGQKYVRHALHKRTVAGRAYRVRPEVAAEILQPLRKSIRVGMAEDDMRGSIEKLMSYSYETGSITLHWQS